jgi:hypothetical protein
MNEIKLIFEDDLEQFNDLRKVWMRRARLLLEYAGITPDELRNWQFGPDRHGSQCECVKCRAIMDWNED